MKIERERKKIYNTMIFQKKRMRKRGRNLGAVFQNGYDFRNFLFSELVMVIGTKVEFINLHKSVCKYDLI